MGARDYDATLGQFTTPDPLYFEDLEKCQRSPLECSLYGYAAGNPISFTDPTGTDAWDAFIQRPPTHRAPVSQAPEYVQAMQHDFAATDTVADGTIALAEELRPSNRTVALGLTIALVLAGQPEVAFVLAMSQASNHDETVLPILAFGLDAITPSGKAPRPGDASPRPGLGVGTDGSTVVSPATDSVAGGSAGISPAAESGARVLSREAQKGIRSLEKRIAEHEKKLADFKANPTVRPGMEGQPKEVIEAAQQSRIRHLETEIRTYKNNIDKLRNGE